VVGAIPGRTSDTVHTIFGADLQSAKANRSYLVGGKLDLRKAFDTVRPCDANFLLEQLGAPAKLLALWARFDSSHNRWVEVNGTLSPQPIRPSRGLAQGDPASPMRLTVLVSAWADLIRTAFPSVHRVAYLDDRVLWTSGAHAQADLADALAWNGRFEQLCGLEDNATKRVLFGTTPAGRRSLALAYPDTQVASQVTVLGIRYSVKGRELTLDCSALIGKAARRGRRIAMTGGTVAQRRHLASSLVVSLWRWAGSYIDLSAKDSRTLGGSVELAVLGRMYRGRNRFLCWAAGIGSDLCPKFSMWMSALRFVRRRHLEAVRAHEAVTPLDSSRVACVLGQMRWQRIAGQPCQVATPLGPLDLAFDTPAAIVASVRHSWLRWLMTQDTRLSGEGYPAKLLTHDLTFDEHARLVDHPLPDYGLSHSVRAALGIPIDAKHKSIVTRREVPEDSIMCPCGEAVAYRDHLVYHCRLRRFQALAVPEDPVEKRLLLRFAPRHPLAPARCDAREQVLHLASQIRLAGWVSADPLLLASDGGAFSSFDEGAASSWAVVVLSMHGRFTMSGQVGGLDASPAFAELWALRQAGLLVQALQARCVTFASDCQFAVSLVQASLAGRLSAGCLGHRLFFAGLLVPDAQLSCTWVPGHDRKPGWRPPADSPWPERAWRHANALADAACTAVLAPLRASRQALAANRRSCREWSRDALLQLVSATSSLQVAFDLASLH
jgi:ribonuclease HI